jgi:hypothetical protein
MDFRKKSEGLLYLGAKNRHEFFGDFACFAQNILWRGLQSVKANQKRMHAISKSNRS